MHCHITEFYQSKILLSMAMSFMCNNWHISTEMFCFFVTNALLKLFNTCLLIHNGTNCLYNYCHGGETIPSAMECKCLYLSLLKQNIYSSHYYKAIRSIFFTIWAQTGEQKHSWSWTFLRKYYVNSACSLT